MFGDLSRSRDLCLTVEDTVCSPQNISFTLGNSIECLKISILRRLN
jgi:hypothetical protein